MASIERHSNGKWRARYRATPGGRQTVRHFARKADAQRWLDEATAALVRGDYVTPKDAKVTVTQWCDSWLASYGTRRASSVANARTHVARIKGYFGDTPLGAVKPSDVKAFTVALKAHPYATSTVYATYQRLSQIMDDAVADGLTPRNPCSRRTSPGMGKQRPYVATTEQVWGLYDATPEALRPAILLGAFAGLRIGEACGLRVEDVNFMKGVVTPAVQYPAEPLKTEASRNPVPIPRELALMLSAALRGPTVVSDEAGRPVSPRTVERALAASRGAVAGLPASFRYHDLRHYFASALIAAGLDVKTVQARLRHGSAKTTLDVYGHLWPDTDDRSRAAVASLLRPEYRLSTANG